MNFNHFSKAHPLAAGAPITCTERRHACDTDNPSKQTIFNRKGFLYLVILFLSLFSSMSMAAEKTDAALLNPALSSPIKISMRNNGYTLGDLVEMRAEFDLKKGLAFDTNSTPLKGPVNHWLDLRKVNMRASQNADKSAHITLDFTWQIFGTVEMAQRVYIPAIVLQTLPPEASDAKPITITIPAQGFHLSPVLPTTIEETNHRPHARPLKFDTQTPMNTALFCFGTGLLLSFIGLWLQDKISWWPRNPGPMTQLARMIRNHPTTTFNTQQLRAIHTALALSARQSLYPNTLENLFKSCPYLSTEKTEITDFFITSWQLFHSQENMTGAISVSATKAWIARAAMAERIAGRQAKKIATSTMGLLKKDLFKKVDAK